MRPILRREKTPKQVSEEEAIPLSIFYCHLRRCPYTMRRIPWIRKNTLMASQGRISASGGLLTCFLALSWLHSSVRLPFSPSS